MKPPTRKRRRSCSAAARRPTPRCSAVCAAASREELRQFHEELYEAYRAELGGVNAMRKMKELWHYLATLFIGGDELAKKIARTKDVYKFNDYVSEALSNLPLRSGE